ncbi:MAG: PadR family transcriptional regulator, partial [Pseudomonadota bacterium]
EQGLEVEEGTLYPLIRRLEKHGLLVSHWREEARRRKRFYQHSELGRAVYAQLLDDWNALNASISQLTHTDLNTADQQGDR